MKRVLTFLAWFIGGGLLGALSRFVLFPLWFDLGWRAPVAEQLSAAGLSQVAVYWGFAWLHVPDWLIIGFTSIIAALVVHRSLLTKLALFFTAFLLVPLLVEIGSEFDPLAGGTRAFLRTTSWRLSGVALGLALAVLTRFIRARVTHEQLRGFGVLRAGGPVRQRAGRGRYAGQGRETGTSDMTD